MWCLFRLILIYFGKAIETQTALQNARNFECDNLNEKCATEFETIEIN